MKTIFVLAVTATQILGTSSAVGLDLLRPAMPGLPSGIMTVSTSPLEAAGLTRYAEELAQGAVVWEKMTGGIPDCYINSKLIVEIPLREKLAKDEYARSVAEAAIAIMLRACSKKQGYHRPFYAQVSIVEKGEYKASDRRQPTELVLADYKLKCNPGNKPCVELTDLKNHYRQRRFGAVKRADEATKDMVLSDGRTNLDRFLAQHRATVSPKLNELKANPFVYEGQTIWLDLVFVQMKTATTAVFMQNIVVSDVPKGLFRSRGRVVLAGRVLGSVPRRTELGGEELVPHLKFVGAHVCKSFDCKEILP